MKITVYWFANGNFAVLRDDQQVPEAQGSWLLSVAEKLEKAGIDPLEAEINLPDRKHQARFFRTSEGQLNWRIL